MARRLRFGEPVLWSLTGPELAAILLVAIPAVGLCVAIFATRRSIAIWDDGADILAHRVPANLDALLAPFHQHLDAVPILIWSIVGNNPPALTALLLISHVVLATATATFLVRRLGPRQGAAVALPLGVLGSAHYNLLMPWQILYTIPLLCGLTVTWLSTRDRTATPQLALIAILMTLAVASSNVGLFLIGALGLWYLLTRRWTLFLALLPASFAWFAWFLLFAIPAVGTEGGVALTFGVFRYVLTGFASAIGGVTGLSLTYGTAILAAAAGWMLDRRPRIGIPIWAFLAALAVMYASLSVFRVQGIEDAAANRYIYLSAFFGAFGLGAAAPRIPDSRWLIPLSFAAAALNGVALLKSLQYYP